MMAEPGAGAPDEVESGEFGGAEEIVREFPMRSDLPTANGHGESDEVEAEEGSEAVDEETTESKDITFVNVFFGTNRRNDYTHTWFGYFAGFFFTTGSVAIYCLFVLVLIAALFMPRRATHAAIGALLAALLVGAAIYAQSKTGRHFYTIADQFGPVGGKLTYGNCIVSVPPCHEPGEMESPLTLWVYRGAEKPDKHIMVQHLESRTPEEFIRLLNQELDDSPGKSTFVFIHGYNVCFRDAIRRTAQLAVDLEFPGPAICFSWPSHADPVRYPFDARNAKASKTALRDFLRYILANSNAEKIHLVAHSMGNLVLAEGLQLLEPEERDRFGYVVMAAPDIDREEFLDPIAPAIARGQLHVTLYASSRDNALRLSKKFHNYQRAGDSLPDLTLCDGVETIDASSVDTSLLGHSYYGDRPTMIKDLGALLIGNKRAAERLADTADEFNGHTYWYIVPE
jgi:esterase/lipase superfamily enzyme